MAFRSPASQSSLRFRFAGFDFAWALAAPPLALLLREPQLLDPERAAPAIFYCLVVFAISLLSFAVFRLHQAMTGHFSVHDALNIAKIAVSAMAGSSTVLFLVTRLDGIPRSTPVIHALVLAAGLVGARLLYVALVRSRAQSRIARPARAEHIVMIAATRLASLYISFLEAYAQQSLYRRRVVALLDDHTDWIGTAIAGVRVVGTTRDLGRIVDEFAVHGVRVDRVIVGGDSDVVPEETLKEIEDCCVARNLLLDFVPNLMGLRSCDTPIEAEPDAIATPTVAVPGYFRIKPLLDLVAATVLIAVLLPFWLVIGTLVLIDVGLPVLFWQQRLGRDGRQFLLHKFRTMRSPFDWRGDPVPDERRQSRVGSWLRTLHLDELPQLLNVFVGEMSLVGPRPLLPRDQPSNPGVRLSVRPGITGWAQVNGGTLLSPPERDALDEWYVRNASPWLDLKILAMTAAGMIRGERRSETALTAACQSRLQRSEPGQAKPGPILSRRLAPGRSSSLAIAEPSSELSP